MAAIFSNFSSIAVIAAAAAASSEIFVAASFAPEISAVVSGDGGDVAVTGERMRRGEGSPSGRVAAAGEESIVLTVDRNNAANYHARVFEQNEVTYPNTMVNESTSKFPFN